MPRTAALLSIALVVVALAGCSDGGGSDDTGSPGAGAGSSASSSTTGPPPKPIVLSDTLHLLAPPEMAPTLPEGSNEVSTPTSTFGSGDGPGQGENPAEWSYQLTGSGNVSNAVVTLWIEIVDTLFPAPPNPTNPDGSSCAWYVSLALGMDSEPQFSCLSEPVGPIDPGTKELTFSLVGLDAELEQNETVTLAFGRNVFSPSPENSVFVLSGSEEHDSRIELKGLAEPVPDA